MEHQKDKVCTRRTGMILDFSEENYDKKFCVVLLQESRSNKFPVNEKQVPF